MEIEFIDESITAYELLNNGEVLVQDCTEVTFEYVTTSSIPKKNDGSTLLFVYEFFEGY